MLEQTIMLFKKKKKKSKHSVHSCFNDFLKFFILTAFSYRGMQSVNLATSPTPMACEIYKGLVKFDI